MTAPLGEVYTTTIPCQETDLFSFNSMNYIHLWITFKEDHSGECACNFFPVHHGARWTKDIMT